MRGGPTPAEGLPPDPVGTELYRVSYMTPRGITFSKLFRQEHAALRFARQVERHHGRPRVHHATVSQWREVQP